VGDELRGVPGSRTMPLNALSGSAPVLDALYSVTEVVLKKKKKMKRTVSHGSQAPRKHRHHLTSSVLALAFSTVIHATTTESQRT
jgi:hypothetical protein